MGEAKRRRQAQTIRWTDFLTGEVSVARFAGDFTAWKDRAARLMAALSQGKPAEARVDCAGCTACCYMRTEIHPEREPAENLTHLKLTRDAEGWTLERRPDGGCIHLGPEGCTIHQYRPQVCRAYDCRVYAVLAAAPEWTDADGNLHKAPPWVFRVTARSDRIHQIALRLAAWPYISSTRNWDLDTAMAVARQGYRAQLAAAEKVYEEEQQRRASEPEGAPDAEDRAHIDRDQPRAKVHRRRRLRRRHR